MSDHNAGVISFGITASNKKGKHSMGISASQYGNIMEKYDRTRMKNQRILDERTASIHKEIPEIEKLQGEIIHLSFQQARSELLQPDSASSTAAQYMLHMKELAEKKQDLLEKHGYPRDYLSPIYSCPDCHDTGYIGSKPCHCLTKAQADFLYANANLSDILLEENFDTFRSDYYDDTTVDDNLSLTPKENITKLREICLDFIRHFDDAYDNLIFYGPTGVGKTFLTHCIAKELLDSGHTVVYLTSLQLFDILEKGRFGKGEESEQIQVKMDYLIHSDLLIIDDLGTELTNSFTTSELYHFIEERHLQQRSTILSTNLAFQELHDRYGERIFSRFTGYYNFCKIIGNDIRPLKRFRNHTPKTI
jgi:DNA replication protein DnaC